jgi:hypothetical protein
VAATRRSSERLTARSAATGDPAIAITSTSSCRAGHGHRRCSPPTSGRNPPTPGRKGLPAGQWFDAGTRVWPVGSLSVEERVGAPRWRQCRDSNADRNGHGFRQIRGRLSRQFPQLTVLLCTVAALWSSLGVKGSQVQILSSRRLAGR